MKKHLAILVTAFVISALPSTSFAQFACANCATWWNQLTAEYELVLQKFAQMEQLKVQIEEYNRALKEGEGFDALLVDTPGFNEFAHAQQLIFATKESLDLMADTNDLIEDSFQGFGSFFEPGTFRESYERIKKRNKEQAKHAWTRAKTSQERIQSFGEAYEEMVSRLGQAKTDKQIAQTIAEQLNLMTAAAIEAANLLQQQQAKLAEAEALKIAEGQVSEAEQESFYTRSANLLGDDSAKPVKPSQEFKRR